MVRALGVPLATELVDTAQHVSLRSMEPINPIVLTQGTATNPFVEGKGEQVVQNTAVSE